MQLINKCSSIKWIQQNALQCYDQSHHLTVLDRHALVSPGHFWSRQSADFTLNQGIGMQGGVLRTWDMVECDILCREQLILCWQLSSSFSSQEDPFSTNHLRNMQKPFARYVIGNTILNDMELNPDSLTETQSEHLVVSIRRTAKFFHSL